MTALIDPAAEAAVVGRALTRPHDLGDMLERLTAADFGDERNAIVWAAVDGLHREGAAWDLHDVHRECQSSALVAVTPIDIHDLVAAAVVGWQRSANRVVELHARRRLQGIGARLLGDSEDQRVDPADLVDRYGAELATVTTSRFAMAAVVAPRLRGPEIHFGGRLSGHRSRRP